MKTLSELNNIETLERFKANLSEAVDKEIEKRKIDERLESIDNMSMGELKNLFESLGSKLFNENKELIGKYVKTIKENKELRTLYALYEGVTSPSYTNNVSSVVDTMIKIAESLDKKAVKKEKEELCDVVKEAVEKSNITSDEFDVIVNENKELNESLDYIFNTKVNAKKVFEHTNKKAFVENYINEILNEKTTHEKTEDISAEEALNEYKNVFEGLEMWESEVVKDLSLVLLSEGSGEDLFNRYKDECLTILSEKIEDSETMEEKSRLSSMKERLSEKKFDAEKLEENIIKLAELKHTISE